MHSVEVSPSPNSLPPTVIVFEVKQIEAVFHTFFEIGVKFHRKASVLEYLQKQLFVGFFQSRCL